MVIQRKRVKSSRIASIGYDYPRRMLIVEFKRGALYRYDGIPGALYEDLMESKSKGAYFERRVRQDYTTKKVVLPATLGLDGCRARGCKEKGAYTTERGWRCTQHAEEILEL